MLAGVPRRTPFFCLNRLVSRHHPMSTLSPIHRPSNWKASAPEALPGTITFAAQPNLPKLPVPDLQVTLTRLKESLKPIAWDNAEYVAVERKIDEFASGQGPELQARLLKRHDETKHWLEEWWDNAGYLGYRDSVSPV
jgi:carnitine O-acetyltransferase